MGRVSTTRHGLIPSERKHGARQFLVQPGDRFGRFTVLSYAGKNASRNRYWLCQCDCGGEPRRVLQFNLRDGSTVSCGCLRKERQRQACTTHGRYRTREYRSWSQMIQRCLNINDANYQSYGAAGITVCERWKTFANFFRDMGPCPSALTLDRIDNTKGYEPSNCRWATRAQQYRNRRSNIWVTIGGELMIFRDAATLLNLSPHTIGNRRRRFFETHQEAIDFYVQKQMAQENRHV